MNRVDIVRRTLGYFRPDRPLIILLLGAIAASTLLGLMQVWTLAFLVDSVLSQMSGASRILPTTIRENIAYGRPGTDDDQIRRAAEMAGVHGFVQTLPEGYETVITEGGQNLSGGQRQRIAIARALLTQAPIIVLDEPTSALDPTHERLVTETLESLKGHRTIILVSHRLSTVAQADQIFVMEGGKIVERGTHEDLLSRGGLYWQMARRQSTTRQPQQAAA